jgi:RNA 3'-terminal phosphate cyclase (ATP)
MPPPAITEMIEIDGSAGEGGGQIIRTSLALSLITGKPFSVRKVRANREKPGLQNQHLTCVRAAAEVGSAEVEGAKLQSTAFTFSPGEIQPGNYRFSIGTAGSVLLVLQTLLPPLMMAQAESTLFLEGGTHNPHAPPFDFIESTFVPLINKMGPAVTAELEKMGFYPPGGGKIKVTIRPSSATLTPLHLEARGTSEVSARCLVIKLPTNVAEREISVLQKSIPQLKKSDVSLAQSSNAVSPGNVVTVWVKSDQLVETITQIGERGLRAEVVAERAAQEVNRYLRVDAAVGEHLADQLLLPLSLAGGGSYVTQTPTLHTKTNIEIIKRFLKVDIRVERLEDELYRVSIHS